MAHADNLRRHFPAVRSTTYLNTANEGLLPSAYIDAAKASLEKELEEGRTRHYFKAETDIRKQVQLELSHALHAAIGGFVLTYGLSHAVNLVLWGLDLQQGDEIVVSTLLSPDVLLPVFVQKQRRNIKLRYIDGVLSPTNWVERMVETLNHRTRLVIVPQVCSVTGQVMALEEVQREAQQHRVPVFIDGSQGAGATQTYLERLNADFYAAPTNKWLCGPRGLGALYINPDWLQRLEPSFIGPAALLDSETYDLSGMYLPGKAASRFSDDTGDLGRWAALAESLQYMRITVGWDYAGTRIHGLTGDLFDALLDVSSVKVWTPREARAGIISFQIAGVESQTFVKEAATRQIETQFVSIPTDALGGVVRVSPGLYNTSDDLQRVLKLVQEYTAKRH